MTRIWLFIQKYALLALAGLTAVLAVIAAGYRASASEAKRKLSERNQRAAEAQRDQVIKASEAAEMGREAGEVLIEREKQSDPGRRDQLDNDGLL